MPKTLLMLFMPIPDAWHRRIFIVTLCPCFFELYPCRPKRNSKIHTYIPMLTFCQQGHFILDKRACAILAQGVNQHGRRGHPSLVFQFQRFSYISRFATGGICFGLFQDRYPDVECTVMKPVSAWATVPEDEYGDEYYQGYKRHYKAAYGAYCEGKPEAFFPVDGYHEWYES